MKRATRAAIGAPVGSFGRSPADPAMSKCEYFSGSSEVTPCCQNLKKLLFYLRLKSLCACTILCSSAYLIQPGRYEKECTRCLMSTHCSWGWSIVALQQIISFTFGWNSKMKKIVKNDTILFSSKQETGVTNLCGKPSPLFSWCLSQRGPRAERQHLEVCGR